MPLYDYDCLACGRRVEVVHGVHAPGPAHCPSCGGGPLRKAIVAPAIHFKGTGWAKKERRATATPGGSRSAHEGSKGEAGGSEGEASTSEPAAAKAQSDGAQGAASKGGGAATAAD
jgi:putative FmdB family regulatory protein